MIKWSDDLILEDWTMATTNAGYYKMGNGVVKVSLYEFLNNPISIIVLFWDELSDLNDLYQPPLNLPIDHLKADVDQFILQIKEMKSFL